MAVTQALFQASLLFGRQVRWDAQVRDGHVVALGEALRGLWPHMLAGALAAAVLSRAEPLLMALAAPILIGLIFAAPFAWLTSLPGPGRVLRRARLCATPEELAPTPEVQAVAADLVGTAPLPAPPLTEPLPARTGTAGR
jgi:membrane glycosyltransferase